MTDEDATRRSRLNGIKLMALVRDHLGIDDVTAADEFAPGAALMHQGAAWVLLDDNPATRLAATLVWALRREAVELNVIAAEGTGVLARRAPAFGTTTHVWFAEGRSLLPAVAEPYPEQVAVPEHHDEFRVRIAEGGANPSSEHGVLVGEVRGLEVCRVVDDHALGSTRLEVGVGAHDREAFRMLHGDIPTAESLARIVETVAEHRRDGAPQHPLNQLAAERLLRARLIDDPALVGMESVEPAEPPVERRNLKDPVPCVALGADGNGRAAVIVCSSGVDLDLVPFAADARFAHQRNGARSDLVIVVPERDLVRATQQVADDLITPATFITLD